MPSVQRGSVDKIGAKWRARWYDEADRRRSQGGFDTRSDAWTFVEGKVEEVAALRRGDPSALRRRHMLTLGEVVEEFVGQHSAEASTIESLRKRLRYALEGPKLDGQGGWCDLRVDRIQPHEVGTWRKRLPARSAFGIHKSLRQ